MEYTLDLSLPCWYKDYCTENGDKCRKICHRYLEMNCLINNCGMKNASKYLKCLQPAECDVEAFKILQDVKDNVVDFVKGGSNLWIASEHLQTGKSSWALKILYKYFDEIWSGNGFTPRGYFLHVPDFLMNLKDFEYKKTEEYKKTMDLIRNVDLLIWDDLTNNPLTQQDRMLLDTLLGKRIQDDKANIVTGLYRTQEKLFDDIGENLANRFTKFSLIVEIKCKGGIR